MQFLLGLALGLVLGYGLTIGLAKMQRPDALPEVTSTKNAVKAEGPGQAQTTPVAAPAGTEEHKQAQSQQQAAGELSEEAPTQELGEVEEQAQAPQTPLAESTSATMQADQTQADPAGETAK